MSFRTNDTKFSGPKRQKDVSMSALALRNVGRRDFALIVAQALRNVTAGMASAAKVLAAAANSNEKSAENWMAGRVLPNALYLKCLEEAFPELDAEIRRIRGLEVGDDVEREVSAMINTLVRKRANEITARENREAAARLSRSTDAQTRGQSGAVAEPPRAVEILTKEGTSK